VRKPLRTVSNVIAATIPAAGWLPSWRKLIRRDALAALAVWAVLVPQSMAYAALAGVPPVYGLYAGFAGLLVYGLLGTSGQLNVGPSSGIAIMSAATVAPLAAGSPDHYLALSAALAIVTGAILWACGLARLGFLAEFLARPVLAGYLIGLALTIIVGQVPALLDIPKGTDGFFENVWNLIRDLGELSRWTAAIGLGTLVLLLVLRAVAPRAPGALIAVVIGVAASRLLDLPEHDVAVLGSISSSLPDFGLPHIQDLDRVVAGAAGIALLAYAESIAAARAFATKHGYEVDANRELVALGAANVGAGLVQGFPIDASLSRTSVGDGAGQRSQLAGLINAALLLATILLLTSFFSDLPKATLAAIVIAAVLPLLSTGELRRLRRLDETDFALAVICLTGVVLFGVLGGIVVAVIASLAALVYRSFRPHTAVLGRMRRDGDTDEDFGFRDTTRHRDLETFPGLVIFRFDQEIFFANAALFRDEVLRLARRRDIRAVVVDASGITHIDTTGLDMLAELHEQLESDGAELVFARMRGRVHDALAQAEAIGGAPEYRHFGTIGAAVAELRRTDHAAATPADPGSTA